MGRAFNSNGQPITPTGTTNRIGRADFEAYRQRRAIEQQQKAQHNIRSQVLDISKLPQQSAYNQLNQARQAGIISKEEHLAKIKEINAREQAKIKSELQKSISPIEVAKSTAGTIGRGVKDFVFSSFETAGKQIPMGTEIGSGSVMTDPAYKTAMEKSINEAYKSGKISKSKADEYRNRLTAQVSTQQKKIETTEKKYGTRYDPSAGVMATLDVASMAAGAPALAKALYTAGKKVGTKALATETGQAVSQKVLSSKPSQYLFGDKTAVQEAVAKAKAPKVVETPKVEPTVAEKPITPPKKIEVTTPQVTKTDPTAALKQEALKYKSADDFVKNAHKIMGELKAAGITDSNKARGFWNKARNDNYTPKYIDPESSQRVLNREVGDNADTWGKWFREQDHSVLETMRNDIESNPSIRDATLSRFYEHYKKISGDNVPFDTFLNREITLYRGGKTRSSNSMISYTPNKSHAARFGDVHEIKIKPKDTYGMLGDFSEGEVFIPGNQTHTQPTPKVEAPQVTKTPVGEQRVTGGAKTAEVEKTAGKVYERMKAEHPEVFTDETSKEAITLKHDAEVAVESIAKDKQKAFNIAMGAETSPDVTSTATNIALVEQSLKEGKHDLANRLLRSRSFAQKRRGQEISAERLATDNSRTKYMQDLLDMKLKKYGEKYLGDLETKVKKITPTQRALKKLDDDVAKMETKIKTKKLTVDDALGLLEKMACI